MLDHTTGPAVAGVEVRVVAPTTAGVARPAKRVSSACAVRSASSATSTRRSTPTAFDDDGWFRTGDLGVIDADGNVTVTGRIKDIIIRNAENISALEIEDALYRHPAVADVAVVGRTRSRAPVSGCARSSCVAPDARRSTLTVARRPLPESRPRGAEVPRAARARRRRCPRNSYGKVLKQDLKARLA